MAPAPLSLKLDLRSVTQVKTLTILDLTVDFVIIIGETHLVRVTATPQTRFIALIVLLFTVLLIVLRRGHAVVKLAGAKPHVTWTRVDSLLLKGVFGVGQQPQCQSPNHNNHQYNTHSPPESGDGHFTHHKQTKKSSLTVSLRNGDGRVIQTQRLSPLE